MDHRELSEVCAGLIFTGKLSLTGVQPEIFASPYDEMIKVCKSDSSWSLDRMISINLAAVQTALLAAKSIETLVTENTNWASQLSDAYVKFSVAQRLKHKINALERGQDIDIADATRDLRQISKNQNRMVRLSEVEPGELKLIKTGLNWLDFHIGGLPEVGLVVVGALPGMGKTSFIISLIISKVRQNIARNTLMFSIEMTESQFKQRCLEIDGTITPQELENVFITSHVKGISDLIATASTYTDVSIVCVDYADLLIQGKVDTAGMEEIYRELAQLAKDLTCPVILISQLNREGSKGGLPRPSHLRWTANAEALAFMILMLYAPDRDSVAEKTDELPIVWGKNYVICWKCRSGLRKDKTTGQPIHNIPGAVQLAWLGEKGWSTNRGKWFDFSSSKKMANSKKEEFDGNEDW